MYWEESQVEELWLFLEKEYEDNDMRRSRIKTGTKSKKTDRWASRDRHTHPLRGLWNVHEEAEARENCGGGHQFL
jgi:hypothetical protein